MNKKIVIFDLDGTLLNTIDDLAVSTNFMLANFGFPTITTEQVRKYVGNGVSKLVERAIPDGVNNPNFEKCIKVFKGYYSKNMYNKTLPYDGVIQMLKKIKSMNIKTAVLSNKFDNAVKELCKKYFSGLIDFSVGENEQNGIRKKPAPDLILKILETYSISKQDAIYAGDSEVDIQTAQNSGIDCISVLWGFKNKEFLLKKGANILISNPDEIFKYL